MSAWFFTLIFDEFLLISRPNVNPPLSLFLTAHTTTTHLPTTPPRGSTEVTTTGWFKHESTTVFLSVPTSQPFSSNEPQTVTAPTGFPVNNVTSMSSHLSTRDNSSTSVSSGSTNDTTSNATSTTDWTSITETTEEITSYNHTEGNTTGSFNDPNKRIKKEGSSSLLVVLVTFLIFCLLVVVIFFAIKLRRAHLAWKRGKQTLFTVSARYPINNIRLKLQFILNLSQGHKFMK